MKPIKDPKESLIDCWREKCIRGALAFDENIYNYYSSFRYMREMNYEDMELGFRIILIEVKDETDQRSDQSA